MVRSAYFQSDEPRNPRLHLHQRDAVGLLRIHSLRFSTDSAEILYPRSSVNHPRPSVDHYRNLSAAARDLFCGSLSELLVHHRHARHSLHGSSDPCSTTLSARKALDWNRLSPRLESCLPFSRSRFVCRAGPQGTPLRRRCRRETSSDGYLSADPTGRSLHDRNGSRKQFRPMLGRRKTGRVCDPSSEKDRAVHSPLRISLGTLDLGQASRGAHLGRRFKNPLLSGEAFLASSFLSCDPLCPSRLLHHQD